MFCDLGRRADRPSARPADALVPAQLNAAARDAATLADAVNRFLPAELPERFVNYPSLSLLGPLSAAAWLEARGATVAVWDALLPTLPPPPGPRPGTSSRGRTGASVRYGSPR